MPYKNDQHGYPLPKGYCKITFDVGDGENPVDPIYVYAGEGVFIITVAEREGYIFRGWYYDNAYTMPANEDVITFSAHCTLYAKWEAIPYHLTVKTDGEGSVNLTEKDYIFKDSITLTTTDVALDYVFVGWYDGNTLLSTDKSYTFSALSRDQEIIARFLSYYDLTANTGNASQGSVTTPVNTNRGLEGNTYQVTATPKAGYDFFGWFVGDVLVSREAEYSFTMPQKNYHLVARFTTATVSEPWDGTVATGFAGGSGTAEDPYLIANGAQLAYMRSQINKSNSTYNNKHFCLVADIDLGGNVWYAIADAY